ncbi:HlyD family efflux transporter periplasmic adaptor subunit [Pseudoalteromonas sp. SG45-5]|uniref:HlyD family secretion protein n=1 Tax=unclassified Pseudoalteromonas TaxID=194690 RepID=UPI0015F9ECEA|nr:MULTISPECIES: HlyD family efflux transporter periplasmic adaptor subunit [unclassified Pseudoalteromonas]MBB1384577.1 HlyD family efflux transporter periplasmic adaptor subunit [Pseudoalteromonas sp. SG45-5]MBB1394452.1 HlyD family efflux transporter periplasmic adaptor subunit [Pseudoalteromonas sp. SG44-4]MBB1446597.1 HlyD family efflux transporter periplasmic adaptor subunit [Pseudoalteromonas sp. SG41-6]
MNINIDQKTKPNKLKMMLTIATLLVVICIGYFTIKPTVPKLSASTLNIITVQQGDIDIMTPVYGQYASRYERLISAPATGQVGEIYLRAGADVEATTIIAKLVNPDLQQQLFESQAKLERMHSEFASFKFQKQNEQLTFQAELADIDSQIQGTKLDVDVNQRLSDQGIAAKIDLERAILKHNQLKKRLEFANYRFEKQKEMHKLELEQQKILLTQQQKQVDLVSNKVAALTITAGIAGTLQRLDIELGERVNQGQAMARVGSKTQLMARLNIPQRIAERIQLGATVELKHPNGTLKGTVKQLASVVENGFIVAEVHLSEPLPSNLRPAQPVNALVFVERKENALYVSQQPGLKPLGAQRLYKQIPNQPQLQQQQITFGELTGSELLITTGAIAGEKIITNDLSQWHTYTHLALDTSKL